MPSTQTYYNQNYRSPLVVSAIVETMVHADGARTLITADGQRIRLDSEWLELPEYPVAQDTEYPHPNGADDQEPHCISAFDNPAAVLDWHEPTPVETPE